MLDLSLLKKKIREVLPIASFSGGVAVITFLLGVVVAHYKLFPYSVLRDAVQAERILAQGKVTQDSPEQLYTYSRNYSKAGVSIYNATKSYSGYTLFTAYTGKKCTNRLINMKGQVIHEWFIKYSDVWKQAPFLKQQFGDEWTCWHGKHLMPNGDLIASFTDNGYPFCGGTVRLNLKSQVVWKLPYCTHHAVNLGGDGHLYIPEMEIQEDNQFRIEEPGAIFPPGKFVRSLRYFWKGPFAKDSVLIASQSGKLLTKVPILDAIQNSPYRGLLSNTNNISLDIPATEEPTHLNDVEVITKEWAHHHPGIQAGDVMVSLRNMSTLVIIDRVSKKVKWSINGPFMRQHDPDLLPNGNILLFDNWGAMDSGGHSRIIELNPVTQQIVWEYGGPKEAPLYSEIRGGQQLLPNGNVLISESTGGRLLEVNRGKEIVWEYINKIETSSQEGEVGVLIDIERFSPQDLPFVKQLSQ